MATRLGKIQRAANKLFEEDAKTGKGGFSYASWYQQHKEELLAVKKGKYQTDPLYRQRAKDRSKKRYDALRNGKAPKDKHVVLGKDGSRYVTIGRLALVIRREQDTIRQYHRSGIIPTPKHFDSRGWRLYTNREVAILREAFRALDRRDLSNLRTTAQFIKRQWRKA